MRFPYINTLIVAALLASTHAGAQEVEVIDPEIAQEVQAETRGSAQVKSQAEAGSGAATSGNKQKVFILNSQPQVQNSLPQQQVQQQPTTFVSATPLVASKADEMRKVRQEAEIATEQKIVERLEASRLEDEKRRAERLFGNKLEQPSYQQQYQQQPVAPSYVQPAPVYVAPQPTHVEVEKIDDQSSADNYDNMKDEIVQSVRAELQSYKDEEASYGSRVYVQGNIGTTEYPDAINIESNVSTGAAIGYETDERLSMELSFQYSNLFVDRINYNTFFGAIYDELDQYNFALMAKYSLLTQKIRPYIGAAISYTRRDYTEKSDFYNSSLNGSFEEASSTAFDAGFVAGVDFKFNQSFAIGLDWRYYRNISSQQDGRFLRNSFWDRSAPVEGFDYYTLGAAGKFYF